MINYTGLQISEPETRPYGPEGFWCAESESGLIIYSIRPNLKVWKTRLFAFFGVMWHRELIFFSENGSNRLKVPVFPFRNVSLFFRYNFFHGDIDQWSLLL